MEDAKKLPQTHPINHQFIPRIEDYIRAGKVEPSEVREVCDDSVKYLLRTATGLSVAICIYVNAENESFLWVESVLGRAQPHCESTVLKRMAELNHNFFYPLRLSLNPKGFVVLQLRGFCAGFTEEQIRVRLESLVPISERIREELRLLGLTINADMDLH